MVNLELKCRNGILLNDHQVLLKRAKSDKTYKVDSIFIEAHKYAYLIGQWLTNQEIPLYVNFLNDGKVLVWNLSRLSKTPEMKFIEHIWDEGRKEYKNEWRMSLKINDAKIYKI